MRITGRIICAALLLVGSGLGLARAQGDDGRLLIIKAARVITVSGEELAPGMIAVRAGRVEAVAPRLEVPPLARVVDLGEGVVMPGLVNARSRFGLPDYRRNGNHADLSAADELYLRPGDLRPVRRSGFVALGLIPSGSGIPGVAVAVRPGEGAREQALIRGAGYLRVGMSDLPTDKRTLDAAFKAAEKAIEREQKARQAWEEKQKQAAEEEKKKAEKAPEKEKPKAAAASAEPEALAEAEPKKPEPKKPEPFTPPPMPASLEPFVALIRAPAEAPRLLVELDRARDLLHFEDGFAARKLTPGFFLANEESSDLHNIVERLGKAGATVLLFPRLSFEPYTRTRRNLPAELARAGARIGFVPLKDDPDGFAAHLASVAELVREGLPRDVALRAMTEVPADVLGLDGELGSLQPGRRADLLLLDGDPFAVGTRVSRVLIGAEQVWPEEEAR